MAMQGTLIEEDAIECCPEKVSHAILDDLVDINLVRRYFTTDAWLVVSTYNDIEKKTEINTWLCTLCHHDLDESESIVCKACLQWPHFKCIGLLKQPKKINWFCRACYDNIK
jgi:hypothetical protein